MLFEDQATSFDERAGLPPEASEAVVHALAEMVELKPGMTLLEVGAGTGQLSLPLLRRPIQYIGFDRSAAMLGVFRGKAAAAALNAELVVADGDERWPAADSSVDVVFGSRSIHLLEPDHVVSEIRRVLRPVGGWLVVGRLRRPQDSVKSVLRRRMRRLLEDRGFRGLGRRSDAGDVFAVLECDGGSRLPWRDVARWPITRSPADALAEWEGKEGLDGIALPETIKSGIAAELRAWAEREYGDLNRLLKESDTFELAAIDLRRE